jgi:hypothetical protein
LLGAAGLTRQELVRLLAWLHGDLPKRADDHRYLRASDLVGCFAYYVNLEGDDGRQIIVCRFVVNDDQAADGLLVVKGFTFERRPRTGGA